MSCKLLQDVCLLKVREAFKFRSDLALREQLRIISTNFSKLHAKSCGLTMLMYTNIDAFIETRATPELSSVLFNHPQQ